MYIMYYVGYDACFNVLIVKCINVFCQDGFIYFVIESGWSNLHKSNLDNLKLVLFFYNGRVNTYSLMGFLALTREVLNFTLSVVLFQTLAASFLIVEVRVEHPLSTFSWFDSAALVLLSWVKSFLLSHMVWTGVGGVAHLKVSHCEKLDGGVAPQAGTSWYIRPNQEGHKIFHKAEFTEYVTSFSVFHTRVTEYWSQKCIQSDSIHSIK